MPFVDGTSTEVRALLRLCEEVRTPVAYKAACFIARGDWLSLVSMKVDPLKYRSAGNYLADNQVVSLLKKHPDLDLPIDRKAKAIESFFKAESLCYKTNERLSPLLFDSGHYGERLQRFLVAWRKEVKNLLGRCPSVSELDPRFGPGSTFNNVGDLITVADKLDSDFTATRQAWAFASQSFDETAWSRYAACGLINHQAGSHISMREHAQVHSDPSDFYIRDVAYVESNRFTTVAKTATTDRGICIEPGVNVFFQLGIGAWLTRRLLHHYEWDKETVQETHRRFARIGSLTGSVATIDLSMASDTVSKALVKLLLPKKWYDLLYHFRCTKTLIDGRDVRIEKFSSMGNGYTFELETIIFYTLAKVVVALTGGDRDHTVGSITSVFGDDIIIPTDCAKEMISSLAFFGFQVNQDKSFWSGRFRESCGGDYLLGKDVRPHFQKKSVNEPENVIALHNGLHRAYSRLYATDYDHDCISPALKFVRGNLPRKIRRCRGPSELGDLVLTDDNPENWDSVTRGSIRYLRCWRPVPNGRKPLWNYRPGVQLALALYLAGSEVSIGHFGASEDAYRKSGIIPRIRGSYVSGYRFGRIIYS